MNRKDWKTFMMGCVDDLEKNLAVSIPKTARVQLEELRKRMSDAVSPQARKSCERRLDRLSESASYFRAAGRRLVGERADIIIDGMERCVEGMGRLAQARGHKQAAIGI